MDETDAAVLDLMQQSFPLERRPFAEIGRRAGISEDEAIARARSLKESGIIRQLSAIFDTRRIGYKSSLVAMSVEPGRIEEVAARINEHPGVSHNYERGDAYNLWFTLAVPPGSNIKDEVASLGRLRGVQRVRLLPTVRLFKIGVRLEMGGSKKDVAPSEPARAAPRPDFAPTEEDKETIRQTQKDLEISAEPFAAPARALGIGQDELFARLARYQEIGVMRRFAAILRHREAGFVANGMIVWRVPDDLIESVGARLGSFPQVSHCYQRPTYEDWPYNVFSMIHCKSRGEADAVVSEISRQVGLSDYKVLFSLREFKKTRVEYFTEARAA